MSWLLTLLDLSEAGCGDIPDGGWQHRRERAERNERKTRKKRRDGERLDEPPPRTVPRTSDAQAASTRSEHPAMRAARAAVIASVVAGCGLTATEPPTLDAHGITLGITPPAQARAWAESRGLACTHEPARRRATSRYVCLGDLDAALPDAGLAKAQQGRLLLVHADDHPVHHLSIYRQHSLPHLARQDFTGRTASISQAFGPPDKADPAPDAALFAAVLGRRAASWSVGPATVSLSAVKTGGPYVAITEAWQVPAPRGSGGAADAGTTGATWKPKPAQASTRP